MIHVGIYSPLGNNKANEVFVIKIFLTHEIIIIFN